MDPTLGALFGRKLDPEEDKLQNIVSWVEMALKLFALLPNTGSQAFMREIANNNGATAKSQSYSLCYDQSGLKFHVLIHIGFFRWGLSKNQGFQ